MKKIYIMAGVLLSVLSKATAQEFLTMEQCRDMALNQNRQIAASVQQTAAARYTVASYKANFFPDFKLNGVGVYGSADGNFSIPGGNLPVLASDASGTLKPDGSYAQFPGFKMDYELGWIYTGGITIRQPLYTGGKIRSAYKIAVLGVEMAKLSEQLTETEVIIYTEKAYASMIKAQEMQKVAELYLRTLTELLRNVESAYRNGLKSQNDVLKVQVKRNEAEMNMKKAENALRLASMNLCHYIGRPLNDCIIVSDRYPEIEKTKLLTGDISARPEYGILCKQVEANRRQVRLSQSDMLPQIGVQAGYNYLNGVKLNGNTLFDKGSFSALINVSIPLFHFGERKNKVNMAKAKLQQSLLEQEDKNELMLLELAQAENNLDEAHLECNLADSSLEQAEENRRVSAEQYRQGMETLSDHLEAQLLWQQAWQEKVEAHFNMYLEWVAYRKASGSLYKIK